MKSHIHGRLELVIFLQVVPNKKCFKPQILFLLTKNKGGKSHKFRFFWFLFVREREREKQKFSRLAKFPNG